MQLKIHNTFIKVDESNSQMVCFELILLEFCYFGTYRIDKNSENKMSIQKEDWLDLAALYVLFEYQ